MNSNVTAYILCGGSSTRMQEEKGLVTFNGKSFIAHIIEAVLPITNTIRLVTNNEKYSDFGYPIISDIYEKKGPVGGIYSALKHSKTKYNLILSCDIPNISTLVLKKYLIDISYQNDIIFVTDGNNEYPLVGMYSNTIAPQFKEAIAANKLKLIKLVHSLDYNTIQIQQEDKNAFKNINTKADLEALIALKQLPK